MPVEALFEAAVHHLPTLLAVYWLLGLALLALKAAYPPFDRLTAYGMHKVDVSAGMIERRSGFLVFYTVATTLALLCLAFHVLNIPPTNAFFLSHPLFLVATYGARYLRGHGLGAITALQPHVGMAPQPFPMALALLLAHCVGRFWETSAVHRFSAGERMTALNFLAGISFYVAAVLTVAHIDLSPVVPPEPPAWWALASAVGLFGLASFRQMECHRSLATIRPHGMSLTSTDRHYRVPQGRAFQAMACPHYFFEIVVFFCIWSLKPDRNATLLLLFVVANLAQRGRATRQWYLRQHFGHSYAPPGGALPTGPRHALGLLLSSSGNCRSEVMPM